MIVAYDLRYASDHFAGIGTYAYAVIEALLALPGPESYRLLWNPDWACTRFDLARLRDHERVEWVERAFPPIRPDGVLRVGAWLRSSRPDVYFSPFSLRPVWPGCPVVLTVHDVTPLRLLHTPSRMSRLLYRASLRHALGASLTMTVSEFSRSEILELTKVRPELVRVALPGRAEWPEGLVPRRPGALPPGPFVLLVGDNRPRKNQETLARAWAALGSKPPYLLVAAGPVDPRFESMEQRLGWEGGQRFLQLGWLPPEELAWLYDHAELLLFPSLYEGFGSPLAEALAQGLPAIVSDIPVFHEVGQDAPIYVNPIDPQAWADAIRRLAADPSRRESMRRAGLARAAELTYRRTAETVLAALREVAAAP